MTSIRGTFRDFITGLAFSAAVLFLALVATAASAFAIQGRVVLPGVLTAWFTTENDLPALNFEPNLIGMLGALLFVAALYVLAAFQSAKRVTARRDLNF